MESNGANKGSGGGTEKEVATPVVPATEQDEKIVGATPANSQAAETEAQGAAVESQEGVSLESADKDGDGFISSDEAHEASPGISDTKAAEIAGNQGPASAFGAIRYGFSEAVHLAWWVIAIGVILAVFFSAVSVVQGIFGEDAGIGLVTSVITALVIGAITAIPVAAVISAATSHIEGDGHGFSDIFVIRHPGATVLSLVIVGTISAIIAVPLEFAAQKLFSADAMMFVGGFLITLITAAVMVFVNYAPWGTVRGLSVGKSFRDGFSFAKRNWLPLFIIDAIFSALFILSIICGSAVIVLLASTTVDGMVAGLFVGLLFLVIGMMCLVISMAACVLARSYAYEKMRNGEDLGLIRPASKKTA